MFLLISCTKDYAARYNPITPYVINILIDKDFNLKEQKEISDAFLAWEFASGGQIRFSPTWNQPKPGPFYKHRQPKSWVFIWAFSKDPDPKNFTAELQEEYNQYDGLFLRGSYGENESAYILMFTRSEEDFYRVILHELGHLLRIKHIPKELSKRTVMHEHAKSDCITTHDVKALCDLWGCFGVPQC